MAFTLITVEGVRRTADHHGMSGVVTFTPSAPISNTTGGGSPTTVPMAPVEATLNTNGAFTVDLFATDDPGTFPTGVQYLVQEYLDGVSEVRSYYLPVPHGGGTIDIDSPDAAITPAAYAPTVNRFEAYGSVAAHVAGTDPHVAAGYLRKAIALAKGDLFAATTGAAVTRHAVGSSGQLLAANPGSPTGLSWITPTSAVGGDVAAHELAADPHPQYTRRSVFDVRDFGAVGNGTTDDTAAFQAAIDAALAQSGVLRIPGRPSGKAYLISDTLVIAPLGGATSARLMIEAEGIHDVVRWDGPDDTPVFQAHGWKGGLVRGVSINIPTASGVVGWEIDTTVGAPSTTHITFQNCFVGLNAGEDNVGWRMGHTGGGISDVSFIQWENCFVNGGGTIGTGGDPVSGQRGWVNEGGNSLNLVWLGGFGAQLEKMLTNRSGPGADSTQGGASLFCFGLGGGYNGIDFETANIGPLVVLGGRYELGRRFLNVPSASNHPTVTLLGVEINDYDPTDGIVFNMDRPGSLVMDNLRVIKATGDYTSALIKCAGFTGRGALHVRGGGYRCPDPFYTASSNWDVTVQGVGRLDASHQTLSQMGTRLGAVSAKSTLTYGTTITPNVQTGGYFTIVATNTTAFTVANPTSPTTGRRITLDIKNSSGGALGAITWGAAYLLAGAFTSPANTKRRLITFIYDGNNWVEQSRTAADI